MKEAFPIEHSALLSKIRMFIIKTLTFTQDGHQPGVPWEFKNGPQWQATAKGHSVSTLHLVPGDGITK